MLIKNQSTNRLCSKESAPYYTDPCIECQIFSPSSLLCHPQKNKIN
uniref:Uncharacterized protein n=1 Tax=Anguilla anguilla TaxID=7936 RepID=A0A0E9UV26_ANGAN